LDSVLFERASKMDTSKEKIHHILQFFFDKGENASQAVENVNNVYSPDTVSNSQSQFWFRRFRSGNFDVKDAPRSGRPIIENVDKIMEIESDRAQELNIAQKTVWNYLNKAGYKKKLDVWVPHELTQKNLMRFYAEKYPNRRHPDRKTIKRLCTRAENGSLKRERRKSGASEEKSVAVVAAAIVDPHMSTREIKKRHDIPKSTANRILKAQKFHPYHIHMLQKLEETDYPRRLVFCNWVQGQVEADPAFVAKVLFSDEVQHETTFTNKGDVNRHNMHYYADVNPHWKRHKEFQHFVRTELPNLLRNVPHNIQEIMWFQQDGAPAHRSRQVKNYLNERFSNRWIGLGSTTTQIWPPRSPDLTPLDFFLWGYLKEKVYKTEPTTMEDMKDRIRRACQDIPPTFLQNVRNSFQRRINKCMEVNGEAFEHLK
ncbi:SETMR methyltransferase, partial [Acromyrmex insinuator]